MIILLGFITFNFILPFIIKDEDHCLIYIIKILIALLGLGIFIIICGITNKLEESCNSLYKINAAYVFIFWSNFALLALFGIAFGIAYSINK